MVVLETFIDVKSRFVCLFVPRCRGLIKQIGGGKCEGDGISDGAAAGNEIMK